MHNNQPRPVIAVFASRTQKLLPGGFMGASSQLNTAYTEGVRQNGGIPILLPVSGDRDTIAAQLALCGGALFPGGVDVAPARYGEAELPGACEIDEALDEFHLTGFSLCREMRLPVLGICRGVQVMNVGLGGTLYQDLARERGMLQHLVPERRREGVHVAQILPGSRLHALLGAEARINSMHHQAIRTLAPGLRASACTGDGVVEAVEDAEGLLLGVQWHPEELTGVLPEMNALFADLVRRAWGLTDEAAMV